MGWKQQSRLLSRADKQKQKQKQQALIYLPCGIKIHSTLLICIVVAALVPLLMIQVFTFRSHHQPNEGTKERINQASTTFYQDDEDNSVTFHFIVSSECSSYQLWETITQLHSAEAVRQCGRFTWIISGCLPNDRLQEGIGKSGAKSDLLTPQIMQQHVDHHFPPPSSEKLQDCSRLVPELHFTPDFSDMSVYGGPFADGKKKRVYRNPKNGKETTSSYGNRYVFNNKPNGLLHWAEAHATENLDNQEAIVLIDPDFLFLARFHLVRPDVTIVGNRHLNQALKDPKKLSLRDSDLVKPGQPAAASYGLGAQWLDFDLKHICGRDSHCTNATPQDVHKYYSAGPPYVIHRTDVLVFATKWASLVPATYDEYPLLYAEMYAYSMAAAHLQLRHNLLNGLFTGCMVGWPNPDRWSDPKMKEGESLAVKESAKLYRNRLEDELANVIADTTSTNEDSTDINDTGGVVHVQQQLQQPAKEQGPASCFLDPISPPPMLHYCNRYMIEATDKMKHLSGQEDIRYRFFAKRAVTHNDVLRHCDDQHRFVPFTSIKDSERMANGNTDWNSLAVCAITRALNFARHEGCHRRGATIGGGG